MFISVCHSPNKGEYMGRPREQAPALDQQPLRLWWPHFFAGRQRYSAVNKRTAAKEETDRK